MTNPTAAAAAKKKRLAIVATLLVVIAGLAAAAGLVLVNRDSAEVGDDAQYVIVDSPQTTPVFEPRDARGNDPFYPIEMQLASFQADAEAAIDEQVAQAQADAGPGETVERPTFDVAALDEAVKTGLYGGTEENTCDPERLISFLYANPDLGEAWAKVQGIEFGEIANYIRSLEVRVLAEPLNVLNHGYNATTGAAYEIDAVLDAGTAVLVDADGNVRTRCYCGNPIRPKLPESMPPRCLVYGTQVFVEPGRGDRRNGAPKDVVLTGRETTLGSGGKWVEIKWGAGDNERGWVSIHNLRKSYCPTPTSDRYCPGPDTVDVWHSPDTTTKVGQVSGQVRTSDTSFEMFAPINPVGGIGGETISPDGNFMLIRFKEAAPSVQNSAWVKLSDLRQESNECFRVRQCINTEGPVWERAGGAIIPGADGVIRVEFTGHFVSNPLTHAEVRLNDGSGNYAWVGQFYTPLPDERCERDTYDCVEDAIVLENSDGGAIIGELENTSITIVGGPSGGRVQVEFSQGGPRGWVSESSFFDGFDRCSPTPVCVTTSAMAFMQFPTNGASIPAIGSFKTIDKLGQLAYDGGVGYDFIRVDGSNYWIDSSAINAFDPADCRPDEDVPDCVSYDYLTPLDDIVDGTHTIAVLDPATEPPAEMPFDEPEDDAAPPYSECCVSAFFHSPNDADVAVTPVPAPAIVVDVETVDGVDWFRTPAGLYFRQADVVDSSECAGGECPEPMDFGDTPTYDPDEEWAAFVVATYDPGEDLPGDDAPGEDKYPGPAGTTPKGDCCVTALFTGINSGVETGDDVPRFVDVAEGPIGSAPAWFKTTDDAFFPEGAVALASVCAPVDCPTDDPTDTPTTPGIPDYFVSVAIASYYPGDGTSCCVQGALYDAPDGEPSRALTDPIFASVIEVDGDWYRIVTIDGTFWIEGSQFADASACSPGTETASCPYFSEISVTSRLAVADICCVQLATGDAFIAELTGETRTVGEAREFRTLGDPEWVDENDFVDASLCDIDDQVPCPPKSVISDEAPLTCCVSAQADSGYASINLTGETEETAGGVTQFLATDGEWYLDSQFASGADCEQEDPSEPSTPQPPAPSNNCNGTVISGQCCERPNEVVDGECEPPCQPGEERESTGLCSRPVDGCENSDEDAICDSEDNCDFNANESQTDSDNDGTGDACDNCTDADGDLFCETPGAANNDNCWGVYNTDQTDTDGDGVGDDCDNCRFTQNADQADEDGDARGDACEDSDEPEPTCGQGDDDNDGRCNGEDNCNNTANPNQTDSDGDGVGNECDNCPNAANSDQADTYGITGQGDACEEPEPTCGQGDDDNDGRCNGEDNCNNTANPSQTDADGDGYGDPCDNCPNTYNQDQADTYGITGQGDACEDPPCGQGDDDNDGRCNGEDNCNNTANPSQTDSDGDGVGDECDNCPNTYNQDQADTYGITGQGDACEEPEPTCGQGDDDNDGRCNGEDNCNNTANPSQTDADGDGYGDPCDNCPNSFNNEQQDSDGDGHGDGCDTCPDPQLGLVDASNDSNPSQGLIYDLDGNGTPDSCYYFG